VTIVAQIEFPEFVTRMTRETLRDNRDMSSDEHLSRLSWACPCLLLIIESGTCVIEIVQGAEVWSVVDGRSCGAWVPIRRENVMYVPLLSSNGPTRSIRPLPPAAWRRSRHTDPIYEVMRRSVAGQHSARAVDALNPIDPVDLGAVLGL
jgi:hypothetical protein